MAECHTILGAPRPGEARLDCGQIDLDDLGVQGIGVAGRKGSDLLKEFDRFLGELDKSGELKKLKAELLSK